MRLPSYIAPSELTMAFDAFELLALKGEVERFEIFRDNIMPLPELGIEGTPNVLFCRVVLTNGEEWHCPVFGEMGEEDDPEQAADVSTV